MPTITFTWNSVNDARTCDKCRALHGYTWSFKDEMPTVLEHPSYGVVWDLVVDEPRAHGLQVYNDRCWLTIEIDDSDVYDDLALAEYHTEQLNATLTSAFIFVTNLASALEAL